MLIVVALPHDPEPVLRPLQDLAMISFTPRLLDPMPTGDAACTRPRCVDGPRALFQACPQPTVTSRQQQVTWVRAAASDLNHRAKRPVPEHRGAISMPGRAEGMPYRVL